MRRRGPSVCDNREWIPLPEADQAVLSAFAQDILDLDVTAFALDHALGVVSSDRADADDVGADRQTRLAAVDQEIDRLTAALAAGGDLPSDVAAIRDRETLRTRLRRDLDALDHRPALSANRDQLRADLEALLEEWRGILRGNVTQGRQILKRLLRSRLTFVREQQDGVDGWRFSGEATVEGLISGLIPHAQTVASPTMKSSHPEMPSWTDLAADLDSMRKLAGLLRSAA
jgi:hypothetical protein